MREIFYKGKKVDLYINIIEDERIPIRIEGFTNSTKVNTIPGIGGDVTTYDEEFEIITNWGVIALETKEVEVK